MPPRIDPPDEMPKLKHTLTKGADPLELFIEECREQEAGGVIHKAEFFKVYAHRAEENGNSLCGVQAVTRTQRKKAYKRIKRGSGLRVCFKSSCSGRSCET